MSIGKTLLLAILGVSLISVSLMTLLAYSRSEIMLEQEIRGSLRTDAANLMQQIDTTLFERLQDLNGWRKLDIMQDTRVGDVDKRLTSFLTETRSAYGSVYQTIFCVDAQNRIVASSTPEQIGQQFERAKSWLTIHLSAGDIELLWPHRAISGGEITLAMRASLVDAYSQSAMGELYALLNWHEIQRLMEQATNVGEGRRHVVLLDTAGNVIAASASLMTRGIMSKPPLKLRQSQGSSGTFTFDLAELGLGTVEAGFANSSGYQQLPGFGWQLLLMEPKSIAFSQVAHLLWALLSLLAITMLLGSLMAFMVARRIARPIQHLTEYTRRFQAGNRDPVAIAAGGRGEIGELTRAFADMMANLQESELRLVQAAKLTVVGEMAAIMAHEVRTPLGILRSSGQLLAREPSLTTEGREMVDFVLSETERLNRLITSLIDCARPRPPHFEVTNLHHIIERAVDLVSAQTSSRAINISTQLHATEPELRCDQEQLLQVFLNLLMNAAQAISSRGRILVTTAQQNHSIVVNVEDDGPGIPAERRDKIFDPFVSYRSGGIGLGLTVVHQIIKAHGATITVEQSDWGGALFRLIFPNRAATEDES
ncbi:MAG: ATP-binding protein [Gammaproteobacteria bacterium]